MAEGLFEQMLSKYRVSSDTEHLNATREVMQQVALAGLARGGFFEQAAFYGGTCLRVFYGLDRASEDMDFSLLEPDCGFSLEPFFDAIVDEFALLGKPVTIGRKKKSVPTSIDSAFLKNDTALYDLRGNLLPTVRVKIEVDTNPPLGFQTEYRLSMHPFSFMTRCYSLPSSFAGKMSALIYRNWRNRVKGRDWYDFEWYVKMDVPMDLAHYRVRVSQIEGTGSGKITETDFRERLKAKIIATDIKKVKADVMPFIKDDARLNIWSTDYFIQLADMMLIEV